MVREPDFGLALFFCGIEEGNEPEPSAWVGANPRFQPEGRGSVARAAEFLVDADFQFLHGAEKRGFQVHVVAARQHEDRP